MAHVAPVYPSSQAQAREAPAAVQLRVPAALQPAATAQLTQVEPRFTSGGAHAHRRLRSIRLSTQSQTQVPALHTVAGTCVVLGRHGNGVGTAHKAASPKRYGAA